MQSVVRFGAVHGFWPVKDLVRLADGPTRCGELARGGCLIVTMSTALTAAERRH